MQEVEVHYAGSWDTAGQFCAKACARGARESARAIGCRTYAQDAFFHLFQLMVSRGVNTTHELALRNTEFSRWSAISRDELEEYINEVAFLLRLDEDYARNGGSIGAIEITDLKIKGRSSACMEGSFNIRFDESLYMGCRDIEWKDKWSGSAKFHVDLKGHVLSFDLEAEMYSGHLD